MSSRQLWIIVTMLLVFCSLLGLTSVNAADKDKTVLIGITEDLSGFSPDAGRAERDGAILAIEEWNAKGGVQGMRIKYEVRDNAGDPTKAIAIARQLAEMRPTAVVTGTSSTVGIPESKVFTPAMIPQMGGSASTALFTKAPDGEWYYFSNPCATPIMAEAALPHLAKKGYKNIAFIITSLVWPKDLRDIQKELIKKEYGPKYGMKVVADIEVDVNATDITTSLYKLKQINPDCISTIFYPVNTTAYFNGIKTIGWTPPPVTYVDWPLTESVYISGDKKLLGGAVGWGTFQRKKQTAVKKLKEFISRFNYEPVGHWAYTYDGVNCLLRAINAVGTDGPAIRKYIETRSSEYETICGAEGARANYTKANWHSILLPKDFAFCYIDQNGKLGYPEN